jgi:putative ABC transport system ATP-binding protein
MPKAGSSSFAHRKDTPLLALKNVQKIYRMGDELVHALKGIDLTIKREEFTAIVGQSGSGKSTLLHLVGALDTPTHGTIHLDGHDIARLSDDELAKLRGRKIGFVFQSFNLVPTLSAKENVELPLVFAGVGPEERSARAIKMLERVGLGNRVDFRPTQLSGGQQQRVAIARALVSEPEMVLADEPTGNLDSRLGEEIIALLRSLHEEGRTLVIVTHDLALARRAKRRVVLKDGQIDRIEESSS